MVIIMLFICIKAFSVRIPFKVLNLMQILCQICHFHIVQTRSIHKPHNLLFGIYCDPK